MYHCISGLSSHLSFFNSDFFGVYDDVLSRYCYLSGIYTNHLTPYSCLLDLYSDILGPNHDLSGYYSNFSGFYQVIPGLDYHIPDP